MGTSGISKSQVPRLCEEIHGEVKAILGRPIEGDWPYLRLDATCVKGRRNGRAVPVAAIVGVDGEGRRAVLGTDIGPSEAEAVRTAFLRQLRRRGLCGVEPVAPDAHEGIEAAVAEVPCATRRRCRAHRLGGALARAGRSGRRVVPALIATAFAGPRRGRQEPVAQGRRSAPPELAAFADAAEADVPACMTFPKDHRTKVPSANPLERSNGGIERRAEVAGIVPNAGDRPARRRRAAGAERPVGRPARPPHDAGDHRPARR